MRAGVRALLLGAALALVAPAPGLACEARGDRDPASQRLGVVFWSREPPSALLQVLVERAIELALAREIERDVELGRLRHPRVDVQVLVPSSPLRVRPLDFDGARLGPLIELGRADGRRCLEALGYSS